MQEEKQQPVESKTATPNEYKEKSNNPNNFTTPPEDEVKDPNVNKELGQTKVKESHNLRQNSKTKRQRKTVSRVAGEGKEQIKDSLKSQTETTKIRRKTKERRKLRAFTRRLWGDEEDKAITTLVKKYGTKKWTLISRKLQEEYKIHGRSGKQCRER